MRTCECTNLIANLLQASHNSASSGQIPLAPQILSFENDWDAFEPAEGDNRGGPSVGNPPFNGEASNYPILIVDDNEGICILIARMLSNMGFKSIYIANSAKQAYDIFATAIAESQSAPIIFLDLRLPDVPGEKVAKKIIEIRPSSKIILVTAEDSSAESAQEALRQGAAAYIQKPIGLSKIRTVLVSVIGDIDEEKRKREKESQ